MLQHNHQTYFQIFTLLAFDNFIKTINSLKYVWFFEFNTNQSVVWIQLIEFTW